ncbi:MAG: peptidoglycan DD-metalloendopeptidase family protein [Clostridiales bacterium]|nr:peptidoglycan DD-metalloendopeptidase family protein [Clostridiales bacterium]
MKRNLKIMAALSLMLALCLGVFGLARPAYSADSDPLADLAKQQEQIAKNIEAKKKELQNSKNQLSQNRQELILLDLEMEQAQANLEAAGKALALAEAQVTQINARLDAAAGLLDQRLELFKERLVVIYTSGELSMLNVLFQSESFHDFLVNFDILKRVMQQDARLLDQIKADMQQIEEDQSLLRQRLDACLVIAAIMESNVAALNAQQAEKALLIAKIEQEIDQANKAIQDEEAESNRIAEEIRRIQEELERQRAEEEAARLAEERAAGMGWPVDGYVGVVTSQYGMRVHPVTGAYSMHTGVDLRAYQGTKILAAQAGMVIVVSYSSAYGNYIIIDHGGGISTFYAHLTSAAVKAGEQVKKGEYIGMSGMTGLATGYHLHFEVRVNGNYVDPMSYLKY